MAKKKKSSSSARRDTSDIANVPLLTRPLVVHSAPPVSQPVLDLEDRRRFNPTKTVSRPASIRRDQARLTHRQTRKYIPFKTDPVSFADPVRVSLCARREIRKQVLHAKKVAGRSGLKKPRRNFWSSISCKR